MLLYNLIFPNCMHGYMQLKYLHTPCSKSSLLYNYYKLLPACIYTYIRSYVQVYVHSLNVCTGVKQSSKMYLHHVCELLCSYAMYVLRMYH